MKLPSPHIALAEIMKRNPEASSEKLKLNEASGRILSADVISAVDNPMFNQSAVDGYAIKFHDTASAEKNSFSVIDEIAAGSESRKIISPGEAFRIFTGAAVPEGADLVCMQEYVTDENGSIEVAEKLLSKGNNIRLKGEQIRKGDIALPKGTVLTPASIGFLASLGVSDVPVFSLPKISIVITGNELNSENEILKENQIYESNGKMLAACLQKISVHPHICFSIDDEQMLTDKIISSLALSDILFVSGGVSVGKYDFTRTVLEKLGFEIVLHGINQKPGKPMLFAEKNNKYIFGLPGNPRSALICYYVYLYPFLLKSMGNNRTGFTKVRLPLENEYHKKDDGKFHLLTIQVKNGKAGIQGNQASHLLKEFAVADGIALIEPEMLSLPTDTMIEVELINTF